MTSHPVFSIIVPTYRRPRLLAACLASLARLDYPRDRFEVVVVDDGGDVPLEPVVAAARQDLDVCLVTQAHGGSGAARNAGSARARGEILACTSDDCAPDPHWLAALAARHATAPPNSAVGGRMMNALPDNPYSSAAHLLIEYLYAYYNAAPGDASFFTPNNLSLPRAAFADVGGFDAAFVEGAGEDRDFCDRWRHRGYPMLYCSEAVVAHTHPLTLRSFCGQQFRYGRGSRRFREARARRRAAAVRVEPLSFYGALLRYPLAGSDQSRRLRLAALMLVSQAANAAGFLWQGRRRDQDERRSA